MTNKHEPVDLRDLTETGRQEKRAEQERAEREARRAADAAKERRNTRQMVVGVTCIGAALLLIVFGLIHFQRWAEQRWSSGKAEGSEVLDDSGTRTIVLYDRIGSSQQNTSQWRVSFVDPSNGKLVKLFSDVPGGCVSASSGRVWCEFRDGCKGRQMTSGRCSIYDDNFADSAFDGLELLDRATLTKLLDFDDTVDGAGMGKRMRGRWKILKGAAWTLLDNGRGAHVDPESMKLSVSDELPHELAGDELTGTFEDLRVGKSHLEKASFTSGAVKYSVQPDVGRGAIVSSAATMTSGFKFLDPTFLVDNATGKPMVVGSDPVIIHVESLNKNAPEIVSRIRPDGTAAWSFNLGAPCEQATLVNGAVVLTSKNEDQRAVAIDAETGAAKWTVAF